MMEGSSSQLCEKPADSVLLVHSRDSIKGSIYYVLFFLSGMSALIYEIVWTRRLTLIFGITVYSISTVLVAFMGGLALGSILVGSRIDKRRDPLRVYAFFEIGIGICALLLPFALSALNPAYRFLYQTMEASPYLMSLAKFLMSAGVLIVPTTMMGATLPVLSKFIVKQMDRSGAAVGSLYAVNTLGALSGCFLAGFVLLGWIGVSRSEWLAVSINILIGIAALIIYYMIGPNLPADDPEELPAREAEDSTYHPANLRLILLIFGLSGMAALAYEVLWSRILVFLLGSSIYSFSMILTVYLLGITGGSFLFSRHVDGIKKPLTVFGWLEILIGLTVLAGLVLFQRLPFSPYSLKSNPVAFIAINFFSTAIVVLPPTLLMGAVFPLVVKIYARRLGTLGRQTGTVYAVNTVGAIIGSFIAGFILIPLFGSKNSMLALILLSICCGLGLLFLAVRERESGALNYAAAVLVVLPMAGFPIGNDLMETLSVRLMQQRTNRDWKVIAFNEDATAAVAVAEDEEGTRLLTVNGISMTYRHAETQLMAHLPLAMMQNPKKVLIICFGMGTTFVSARHAGMDVDFVELCPDVVDSFQYYQEDPSMLTEPGARGIIADGRNYLLLSDKKYDLITIDPPPPPYSAGTVNLYTKEFYELCKRRLSPGGIVCQWIPIPASTEAQYKMLVRTFMEVFPHTSVWGSVNRLGTYLLATPERLDIDRGAFAAYFLRPEVRDDLSLYMKEAPGAKDMFSLLLLDEDSAKYYVQGAPVLTDDLPLIEFPLFHVKPYDEIMSMSLIYGR
ncbi:MAG: spermidine synthase [Candidatus Abyssobacteria bacterium SURF_5]|uniref:Spermidine synthase n=1 Tax=Abyssobacteria bacterium (strain SURF_5) TaxID=2093360 RepID=A0A3A4P5T3_ABYX5|nr:MAG: spermidine synthase [Candidatus Abyssubacteria bacterium SURF_5]